MRCPHCGVGEIEKDNCSNCTWPYSLEGWKQYNRGIKRLSIDTGCINAKGNLASLNTLERWKNEGKLEIQRASSFLEEFRGPDHHVKKAKEISELPALFFLGSSILGRRDVLAGPDLRDVVKTILFPTVAILNQNQEYDVQHLHEHIRSGGDIFVTLNLKDFIYSGKKEKLRKYGVWVLTPDETLCLIDDLYGWS